MKINPNQIIKSDVLSISISCLFYFFVFPYQWVSTVYPSDKVNSPKILKNLRVKNKQTNKNPLGIAGTCSVFQAKPFWCVNKITRKAQALCANKVVDNTHNLISKLWISGSRQVEGFGRRTNSKPMHRRQIMSTDIKSPEVQIKTLNEFHHCLFIEYIHVVYTCYAWVFHKLFITYT